MGLKQSMRAAANPSDAETRNEPAEVTNQVAYQQLRSRSRASAWRCAPATMSPD
jgi:hypothetical protein